MKTKIQTGKWTKSQWLQFAAFMVAAPRYMAMGAMALGISLTSIHWIFIAVEVGSWLGFAVLEGYAIPYIAKGIRRFEQRTFEWWQLQTYRALLLLAIPVLGSPLYLAISQKRTILEAVGVGGFVVWSFILTGIGALIIDAVGTVEGKVEPETGQQADPMTTRQGREAHTGPVSLTQLAELYAGYYHEMTPDQFIAAFEAAQGKRLTTTEAETALLAARAKAKLKLKAVNGHVK